ncbi:MAG: alpha-2-macroglobulin family protein, partial [Gemmataceae bacterium]
LGLMAVYVERDDQKWRDTYAVAPKPDTDRWGNRTAAGAAAPPAPMAADAMPMADAGGMPLGGAGGPEGAPGGVGGMRPRVLPGGAVPEAARGFAGPKGGQPPAPPPPPAPAGGVQRMQMMKGVADPAAQPKDAKKGGEREELVLGMADERRAGKFEKADELERADKAKKRADGEVDFDRNARDRVMLGARRTPLQQPQFTDFLRRRNAELAAVIQKEMNQPTGRGRNPLPQLTEFRPQYAPLPVREYAHTRPELADDAPREDFTETLLWQPVIVTPTDGKATVTFSLSDDVAPYRVLVAGHTLDGRIGAVSGVIEVRKPFALDPKLPQEISSSDILDVPVAALNGTDAGRKADVSVSTVGLKVAGDDRFALDLAANAGGRKFVRLTPSQLDGELRMQLEGKAGGDRDSVIRTLTVVPDGFPLSVSASDVLEQKVSKAFKLPEQIVPGTLKMKVSVYPNTLSEVQAGLEGMLREPYGCFEQTSTTNYPNVLILDYLNETNQAKPDVSKRAKELLDRGYGKLVSFECQKPQVGKEGYEWFGGTAPPHEALTAYGLLQFTDMARVHPVDAEMLKRTREYLLSARDGLGGFKKNARALDTFGYAPKLITDAYIVWAISESERTADAKSDLDKELAAVLAKTKDGDTAKDPYYLGLAANALLNRGQKADGEAVLKALAKMQQKDGSIPGAKTSITNSVGEALLIETTGMAVLGWLKANETGTYRENVDSACKWIGTKRGGYGGYGSTQSTILALKALIEYAR